MEIKYDFLLVCFLRNLFTVISIIFMGIAAALCTIKCELCEVIEKENILLKY